MIALGPLLLQLSAKNCSFLTLSPASGVTGNNCHRAAPGVAAMRGVFKRVAAMGKVGSGQKAETLLHQLGREGSGRWCRLSPGQSSMPQGHLLDKALGV